ncbi:DDE_3 domain-containing protein [Trichonephila clavipes]|nr:DDE_3 domain-containing protein [Trichonephila clavipes]
MCRQHRGWSMDHWTTVLFTDMSHFSLNTNSPRTSIRRKPGIRNLPSNVRQIDNYGGKGLMEWAGIMLDSRSPLHVFERGSVTGVNYRDEVLEIYVHLFKGVCKHEFILMDDNAIPQRALMVDEILEIVDIRRKDRPVRSPDLNPIEHVWDVLGRAIATRKPSEDQQGNKKIISERAGPIAPRTDKLLYFKYDITLRGLYSCKREPYPLLINFSCIFCNRCFLPSNANPCYARSYV